MKKRNKTIILISIITLILLLVVGITYAVYVNIISGTTQKLVLGDIYMHYNESNTLTLSDAMPSSTYDSSKYFEFRVDGKNTYLNSDIYYEILLSHGDNHEARTERIKDNLLKFTLVEIKDNTETIVVDEISYDEINNTRIWVNTIPKNTTSEINATYRLYMWISNETKIGNTSDVDYDMTTWNNEVYASIKVNVNGDFEEKEISKTAADLIMSKYGTEENLVAVNTEGTLYDGTGEIREYRYSGATANNYVIFNDDGDGTTEANELWRIVGVFKNSEGNWNLKLMRDNMLGEDEVPKTYTINGTTYSLIFKSGSGEPTDYESTVDTISGSFMTNGIMRIAALTTPEGVYWNSTKVGTNRTDWTTAGLQYYLNTNSDSNGVSGYYSTFTVNAKNLIDENYTYNLGNAYYTLTTITAYKNERGTTECVSTVTSNTLSNSCNIWYGNQPTWNGAISLLYLSDYGYSADSSYWSGTALSSYYSAAYTTSWIQQTANHSYSEWFLSPSSNNSGNALVWNSGVMVYDGAVSLNGCGARPVLNLKSGAKMEDNAGTIDNPYRIIEE